MKSSRINVVEKICDDLYVITETESVHCYFILGKEKAVVFDIGYGYEDIHPLIKEITNLPLMLVLSHGDPDHGLGACHFDDVWLHPLDYGKLIMNDTREIKEKALKYRLNKMPQLQGVIDEQALYEHQIRTHTMPHFLLENDVINLGGTKLEVLHTPGHSYGHIMLLDKEHRRLFSGDQITLHNIWYFLTRGEQAPFEMARFSLQKVWERRDEFDDIYPAHDIYPINHDNLKEQLECFAYELKENYMNDIKFTSFMGDGYQHFYKSVNMIYSDERLAEYLKKDIERWE